MVVIVGRLINGKGGCGAEDEVEAERLNVVQSLEA